MSWSTFLIVLVSIAVIYNIAIVFFYFKGDISSITGKKNKEGKLVPDATVAVNAPNKKSFVGLAQPDRERLDNRQYRAEPAKKVTPILDNITNGILVSDLETCLNEVSRNLKNEDPLSENTKELIRDISIEGEIHVEYDNGKNIIDKKIDVFENIVQL
ncbi:hypothetical protein LCGC14_1729930 [marine sediment metagenome]|uniref:Uncharacterized protein n=1 Tax=marine sediment metagenome TaxID=412755 RepID=A0A0F9JQH8_9ZZZZ